MKQKILSALKDKYIAIVVNKFTLILAVSFLTNTSSIASSNAHPHLTTSSKVAVNGIGPILVGMTVEEAEVAAGVKILPLYPEDRYLVDHCRYFYPDIRVEGISFMVQNGKIARVDVNNDRFSTISGVKIGDSIEEIKSLYPGQIKVEPGFYGGNYLIYESQDPAYKDYLLLFQTYEGVVHEYRVGYVDEVKLLVEGCA